MDYKTVRKYCLKKRKARVTFPFDTTPLVIKVLDKMFALVSEDADPLRINLKCDPEDAQALRAQYAVIIPGYHMSKRHWNTVILDGSLPDELVYEMIDQSYDLVVRGMKKADRQRLGYS